MDALIVGATQIWGRAQFGVPSPLCTEPDPLPEGDTVKVKEGVAWPVPESGTVIGPIVLLMVSVADSVVAVEGVKVTGMMQDTPASCVPLQPVGFVEEKSLAFAPEKVMPENTTLAAALVFCKVTLPETD